MARILPRLIGACAILASASFALAKVTAPSFETAVNPVFDAKCLPCHGAAAIGKLDLRTAEATLKGGASGPVVAPGMSEKSLIIDKVVTRQMPPGKNKLTDAEIDSIRKWIDKGLAVPVEVAAAVDKTEVRAVFQARCVTCHGGLRKEGGLDMRTLASRLAGGKSGPALVPGKPEESLLYKRMANGQMPPSLMAKDLAVELPTDGETAKVKQWIAAGASGLSRQVSQAPGGGRCRGVELATRDSVFQNFPRRSARSFTRRMQLNRYT